MRWRSSPRWRLLTAGVALLAAVAAPPALADPASDYHDIRADWADDGRITPCRWSEAQLTNARDVSAGVPDDSYTAFPSEVDRELARHGSGACEGRTPEVVRERSPLADVQIVRVSSRGGASREYVRLRNRGRRSVDLSRARLLNRRGAGIRVPGRFRVRPGRTVTFRVGCLRGHRRATVRGSTAYACRRRALLPDRGDVVRLADRGGIVVSQRGYGRHRRAVSF